MSRLLFWILEIKTNSQLLNYVNCYLHLLKRLLARTNLYHAYLQAR
ncbi:hypothetical protein HMPREF1872_00327 [Amygdalobacter nucleatus]|uniref:Uncharacterized protein n=1 Tax=Amygdalobacter nucleatus TaxID=3029274 RepID=A0A133YGM1_9FIRM|nr:hypothetical protein HMPREF1872_00327 [Amygdalobacter nucleatus]